MTSTTPRSMTYVPLGRTGLQVAPLTLGTMNFGPETSEADSFAIMDRAHELGLNLFDTANAYGWQKGEGVTEAIIGRWLAQGGGRRERTVLATKLYANMGAGPDHRDWPNSDKLSALNIRRACEDSLRRLQTDHIDLYQMHHVDLGTPWDEVWQAMDTLVAQGKVLYVGSSNFAGWQLVAINEAARRRHSYGLVSEQSIYNLLERTVELEVLPAAQAEGMGIIPWSPLQQGLLGGILAKTEGEGRSASQRTQQRLAAVRPQIEEYEKLASEIGAPAASVGLAWLLAQPAVTAPIIGPRTLEQLDSSVAALDVQLSEGHLARLDEIFPGPGGAAPMAYAW